MGRVFDAQVQLKGGSTLEFLMVYGGYGDSLWCLHEALMQTTFN